MALLRYPGGKSRGFIHDQIVKHICLHYDGGRFGELFFGGGGITLTLIKRRVIDNVTIAEKDSALCKLWWAVINNPSKLIEKINEFKPSVSEFLEAKDRVLREKGSAMDALVANRLAHGGRGVKAGPQGGHDQKGKYKIGCRWTPSTLVKGIKELHALFASVDVTFVEGTYQQVKGLDYLYMDPPYYEVGDRLYQHNFTEEDHVNLKLYLDEQPAWLLSYNNHKKVRDLYREYSILTSSTNGNGGEKKNSELLIWNT